MKYVHAMCHVPLSITDEEEKMIEDLQKQMPEAFDFHVVHIGQNPMENLLRVTFQVPADRFGVGMMMEEVVVDQANQCRENNVAISGGDS